MKQSLRLAGGLALLKMSAGMVSGSMGVLASALDSLLDISASAVNYFTYGVSVKPPDEDHPYGHGKAEALAGLFQGVFVAVSGLALLVESIRRILHGSTVGAQGVALVVMGVSTAASFFHSRRLKRASQNQNSMVMRTESTHFAMDVLSNGAILVSLFLVRLTGNVMWDLGVALLVTVYILQQAGSILVGCVHELMDRTVPEETRKQVEEMIRTHHPEVVGFHHYRARKAGGRVFIDFHLEIRDVVTFRQAHDIAESLVNKIESSLPGADVTIHYDPEGAV